LESALPGVTVRAAALLVAEPAALAAMRVYDPASALETEGRIKEAPVAPWSRPPLRSHWKLGAGLPETPAVRTAVVPAVTLCDRGCTVKTGALSGGVTVSVAAAETAVPKVLVTATE
jgi:hypothetical protein